MLTSVTLIKVAIGTIMQYECKHCKTVYLNHVQNCSNCGAPVDASYPTMRAAFDPGEISCSGSFITYDFEVQDSNGKRTRGFPDVSG